MTDSVLTPYISNCQIQKFIQAGLFSCDTDVVLLTKKEKANARSKAHYIRNHDKKKTYQKEYTINNTEKINVYKKAYRATNKGKQKLLTKRWYEVNKEKVIMSQKVYSLTNVQFDTYKDKLQKYEDILKNSDGMLLIKCSYCSKPFLPTRSQLKRRMMAINGTMSGENRLYCSNSCKVACPIFGQHIHYKFQLIGHTREVPAEFRQMALLNRNYTCENCGSDENGLHVHHILGYTESPMTMADLSNVKVLCSTCHKAVHSVPGCFYVDYSCKHQKQ